MVLWLGGNLTIQADEEVGCNVLFAPDRVKGDPVRGHRVGGARSIDHLVEIAGSVGVVMGAPASKHVSRARKTIGQRHFLPFGEIGDLCGSRTAAISVKREGVRLRLCGGYLNRESFFFFLPVTFP